MRTTPIALALTLLVGTAAIAAPAPPPPLPDDVIPNVGTLPESYPKTWVLIHDFHFNAIVAGRVAIVDTADPVRPLKGTVRVAQFGNLLHAPEKRELYSAETFYSRLTTGERTDAITVWDSVTLKPKGEILLPGGKRQQSVTYNGTFQFLNGKKWAAVANFTPAQSVTVVDLDGRKVLSEIDLPGCSQIYPTGARGFTTFCADGSLTSVQLDEAGKVTTSKTIPNVQDIDNQAQFQNAAWIGQTAWFVTYGGQLKGYDLSGPVARPLPGKLTAGSAEGGQPEWRPGGWQVIASGPGGLLYVLMSPYGKEGSHKDGGSEVWVVDPAKGTRTQRIVLEGQSVSIGVTNEAAPQLIAVRVTGDIDVYDATSGKFARSLGTTVAHNPLLITPVP